MIYQYVRLISALYMIFFSLCGLRWRSLKLFLSQSNIPEKVSRKLIQMIVSYITSHHTDWDPFLLHFAHCLVNRQGEPLGTLGREISPPSKTLSWCHIWRKCLFVRIFLKWLNRLKYENKKKKSQAL